MQSRFRNTIFLLLLVGGISVMGQTNYIDSLRKVLETTVQDTSRVKLMNDIGGLMLNNGQYILAEAYLNKAKKLADDNNYKSGLAVSYSRIGILCMDKNDYPNANKNYLMALQLQKELGDKKGIADVTSNMGIASSDQGDYAKALENYFTALKIREEIGDKEGLNISMMSIANIYFLQNKFTTALEYYLNILRSKGMENKKFFMGQVHNNIGLVYLQLKEYSKALSYFNTSLKMAEQINDKLGVGISYTNIGSVYSAQKDHRSAIELITKGCDLFIEIGDKKSEVEAYYQLGNIYDSLGQKQKAFEYFKKQLVLAKEINSKVNVKTACLAISEYYKSTGNFKDALMYYQEYKNFEDSIQSESNLKTIAELDAKYNSQKKEKEIELLKKEQDLTKAKNDKQNQLILASVVLIVLISFTGFVFYRSNQLKKKNALERKNFELERNALSAQMNPHFIFNSLGTISGFIADNEKEKAVEYLGIFSRLIRHNLEQSRQTLILLSDEAQMLRSYLHLQQLRFDNKFDFKIELENGMDDALAIPPMFIQPFVENSILHGIIPKDENGFISVNFYTKEEKVVCEIKDDGIGRSESLKRKTVFDEAHHKSLATTITEDRKNIINTRNKEKIDIDIVDIKNETGGITGTKVVLSFPSEYI